MPSALFLVCPPSGGTPANRSLAGGLGVKEARARAEATDVLLPSLNLLTCAAVARRAGYRVTMNDYSVVPCDAEALAAEVVAATDAIILAEVALATLHGDCAFLADLKARAPSARIVLLTAIEHAPLLQRALSWSRAELAMLPEGIVSLAEILSGMETCNTASLAIDESLCRGQRQPLADLDRLPPPEWSLLKRGGYAYTLQSFPRSDFVPLQSSRGCPFSCAYYCPYPLTQGNKVRSHSIGWVLERMQEIAELGYAGIVFQDPVFTIDRKRTMALCAGILARNLNLKWACETRIDRLDDELVSHMAKAGCVGIEVGVESGNRDVMREQGKPGLTPEQVFRFRAAAESNSIQASFLFIIGLPKETRASVIDTFRLLESSGIDPEQVNFSIITPYPGTALYEEAVARNWISGDWERFSGYEPVMRTDNLSVEDIVAVEAFSTEFVALLSRLRQQPSAAAHAAIAGFYGRVSAWARVLSQP